MADRSELAEQIVRIMAPYAEAGGNDHVGRVVCDALNDCFLLDDYMRIKAGEQAGAFGFPTAEHLLRRLIDEGHVEYRHSHPASEQGGPIPPGLRGDDPHHTLNLTTDEDEFVRRLLELR